jgi:hypothetical protein
MTEHGTPIGGIQGSATVKSHEKASVFIPKKAYGARRR